MLPLSLSRHYVERGVQTDFILVSQSLSFREPQTSLPLAFLSGSVSLHDLPKTPSTQVQDNLRPEILGPTSAYNQGASNIEDSLGLIPARKERKPAAIGSGYPSTVISSAQRIVSLPTAPSPDSNLVSVEKQTRIVSMPERDKLGTFGPRKLPSNGQADTSSTDISYYSMESMSCSYKRPYPLDLPQTPSPPSSPESVMIIGNEGQVSGSFLRRSCTDEHGWITWASSPPRPIPALHGPLSLPYARCPSGAEGTVIEGDDLSHKIWGLGADDIQTHPRSSRTPSNPVLQPVNSNHYPTFQTHTSTNDVGQEIQPLSFQRQRDTIIDLSKPSTFNSPVDVPAAPRRRIINVIPNAQTTIQTTLPNSTRNFSGSTQGGIGLNLIGRPELHKCVRRDVPMNAGYAVESIPNPLGIALKWDGLFGAETKPLRSASSSFEVGRDYNRLNTAAPPFIPQGSITRNEVGPNTAYTRQQLLSTQKQGRLPAFEIAQKSRAGQDYYLPTPPSTTSPLWTPIFPQHADIDLSGKAPIPNVYSPNLDIDEYSDKLAAMIAQLNGHDLGDIADRCSTIPKFSAQPPLLSLQTYGSAGLSEGSLQSLPRNSSTGRSLGFHDDQQDADLDETSNSNRASEHRRSLSHQHPRSIPLARLIQRRLSSVAEEDVNNSRDSRRPLLFKQLSSPHYNFLSTEPSGSRYTFKQMMNESMGPDNLETKFVVDENAEAAVTMITKGTSNNSGDSKAVVKLPRNKTSLHSSQTSCGSAYNTKQTGGDESNENENNDCVLSGSALAHRKTRNKNKKRPERGAALKLDISTLNA